MAEKGGDPRALALRLNELEAERHALLAQMPQVAPTPPDKPPKLELVGNLAALMREPSENTVLARYARPAGRRRSTHQTDAQLIS